MAIIVQGLRPNTVENLAQIYSIGIDQARQSAQVFIASGKAALYGIEINRLSASYSPDALPNKFGGYDTTQQWDGRMSSSLLGMPIMCYIKFIGGTYVDLQGNEIDLPTIIFDTVLMTVRMNKNIKKTNVTGRINGTVKEDNGLGDWNVEIRAIVTADSPVNETVNKRNLDGVYPRDNMSEIYKLLIAPIAIPIECWFLQQFGINYLVVDDGFETEMVEGEYNMARLTIPCVSDNPLIIKIGRKNA